MPSPTAVTSQQEILACEEAGIKVTLPKPMTSNSKAEGRFGKADFRYVAAEDVYVCPAGEKAPYHYTTRRKRIVLAAWTTLPELRIKPLLHYRPRNDGYRWENEHFRSRSRRSTSIRRNMRQGRDG